MLAAVMFVGTSICGAMPSFAWNVAMCFMMGAVAGGNPLATVGKLLGHALPETTARYTHLADTLISQTAERPRPYARAGGRS